jgi:hypothetical protein
MVESSSVSFLAYNFLQRMGLCKVFNEQNHRDKINVNINIAQAYLINIQANIEHQPFDKADVTIGAADIFINNIDIDYEANCIFIGNNDMPHHGNIHGIFTNHVLPINTMAQYVANPIPFCQCCLSDNNQI